VIVSYGDVLFKKYIVQELTETDDDIVVMVDSNVSESRNRGRNGRLRALLRAQLQARVLQHRDPQGLRPEAPTVRCTASGWAS
jgi:choline kinase